MMPGWAKASFPGPGGENVWFNSHTLLGGRLPHLVTHGHQVERVSGVSVCQCVFKRCGTFESVEW